MPMAKLTEQESQTFQEPLILSLLTVKEAMNAVLEFTVKDTSKAKRYGSAAQRAHCLMLCSLSLTFM